MLKQMEGSHAVAKAVALCRPEVICAYPISVTTRWMFRHQAHAAWAIRMFWGVFCAMLQP